MQTTPEYEVLEREIARLVRAHRELLRCEWSCRLEATAVQLRKHITERVEKIARSVYGIGLDEGLLCTASLLRGGDTRRKVTLILESHFS